MSGPKGPLDFQSSIFHNPDLREILFSNVLTWSLPLYIYCPALSSPGKNLLAHNKFHPIWCRLWNSIRLSQDDQRKPGTWVSFSKFWTTVKESGHRSKSAPNLGYQLGKCGRPWQMWQTIGHSPQFSLKQRLLEILKSGTGENLGKIAAKVVFTSYCREPHWFCPKWGPMK